MVHSGFNNENNYRHFNAWLTQLYLYFLFSFFLLLSMTPEVKAEKGDVKLIAGGGYCAVRGHNSAGRGWLASFSGSVGVSRHFSTELSWLVTSVQRDKLDPLNIFGLSMNLDYWIDKSWISPFIRIGAGLYLDNLLDHRLSPSFGYNLGFGLLSPLSETIEVKLIIAIHNLYLDIDNNLSFFQVTLGPAIKF